MKLHIVERGPVHVRKPVPTDGTARGPGSEFWTRTEGFVAEFAMSRGVNIVTDQFGSLSGRQQTGQPGSPRGRRFRGRKSTAESEV